MTAAELTAADIDRLRFRIIAASIGGTRSRAGPVPIPPAEAAELAIADAEAVLARLEVARVTRLLMLLRECRSYVGSAYMLAQLNGKSGDEAMKMIASIDAELEGKDHE